MTNLEAALDYQRRGWSVMPGTEPTTDGRCTCYNPACTSPGKHPIGGWTERQTVAATEAQVRSWFRTRYPTANVCIATGAVSNLVVIDIDAKSGGFDSKPELGLTPTVTALTGGGGEHWYYQHPGVHIKNGTSLLPGVDVRADGGQVVAPPSRHASGQVYQWEAGYGPDEHEIAPLPPALLARLIAAPTPKVGENTYSSDEIDLAPYISGDRRLPVGSRDDTLTRFAGHLAARKVPPDVAVGTLWSIAMQAEPGPANDAPTYAKTQDLVRRMYAKEQTKDEAQERVIEQLRGVDTEALPNDDRQALQQAIWARWDTNPDGTGGIVIIDVQKTITTAGPEYVLVLPDREVALGPKLLGGQSFIREQVLAASGRLIPLMSRRDWDAQAVMIAKLAFEVQVGPVREADIAQAWLEELIADAEESDVEVRLDRMLSKPIWYQGSVAWTTPRLLDYVGRVFGETALTPKSMGRLLTLAHWRYIKIRTGTKLLRVWVSPIVASEDRIPQNVYIGGNLN